MAEGAGGTLQVAKLGQHHAMSVQCFHIVWV
jgi:hypothetical protein